MRKRGCARAGRRGGGSGVGCFVCSVRVQRSGCGVRGGRSGGGPCGEMRARALAGADDARPPLGTGSCRPLGDRSRPPVTRGAGIRAARSLDFGHETAFWHARGRFLAVFEAREALRLEKPQVARFLLKGVSPVPCQNAVSWPKIGLLSARADGPARVGFCVAEKGRRRPILHAGLRRVRRARPGCGAVCGMRLDRAVGASATDGARLDREAVGAARAAALGLRGG